MNTNRINRIIAMEQNLDAAKQAVSDFEKSLEKFISAQPAIKELSDYYFSKQWIDDYDADCRGEIPHNLKRGVLSEDEAYDIICLNNELLNKLK